MISPTASGNWRLAGFHIAVSPSPSRSAIVWGYLFYRLRLPLPWMLGPMVFCTVAALTKLPVAAPPVIRPPMSVVIGVMLGSGFKPEVIWQLPNWLPTLLGLVAFMAIAGGACVYYFRRFGGLDPVTAFFAGMPGGLVEMVTLGEEKGGDARVIALIHSARVLLVVMTLPFLVQWMGGVSVVGNRASGISIVDTTPAAWMWILVSGFLGVLVGRWLRLPAGQLLGADGRQRAGPSRRAHRDAAAIRAREPGAAWCSASPSAAVSSARRPRRSCAC